MSLVVAEGKGFKMKVEILPATMEDAESLVFIQKKAFKRLYDIYHDEGNPYLRGADEIAVWLSRPNSYVYKIMADKQLVGGVSFWERKEQGLPGVYYLARIYVTPELQGKGIASKAIYLCEETVMNANTWTLDFPVDQPANRRCYEKAGYFDTGERREQSNGKITLAYMEKIIPPFRNIKNHLDNLDIHKILSNCLFDASSDGTAQTIEKYCEYNIWKLFGWVENGKILGICGFEVRADYVKILHISVVEHSRYHGIGSSMLAALQEKYKLAIEAETDDDAVEFYRKIGFETTSIQKYNVRRWTCVLPMPKPFSIETDKERQARIYPIVLSEYNPAWAKWYTEEKANLEQLVEIENIAQISHIGSTSVPGLTAKPTVDILLEIKENTDMEKLLSAFPSSEYICLKKEGNFLPEHDIVMILKGYLPDGFVEKVYHIHVRYPRDSANCTAIWDEIYFRDYLIAHPETAAEYASLKSKLFQDYEHDRNGYTAAKGEFILKITEMAKYDYENKYISEAINLKKKPEL